MKVFHLISGADAGGARTHVLSLLRELNKTEPVPLLTLGDGPLAREAAAEGLSRRVLLGGFASCLRQLGTLLSRERPDLLHCHGARANLTGALLKKRLSLRVISTVHSDWRLDYMGRPLARVGYGTLNAAALRRMDALVCVSDAMAERVRARGFQRVFSVYNGADFSLPRSAPSFPGGGDTVTAQVPESGARVSGGSGFVLLYTNGEIPSNDAEVPDLSGMSIYIANNVATTAGLNVSMSGTTNGTTATVISQSLEPGTRVPRGTVIRIELRYMDGND